MPEDKKTKDLIFWVENSFTHLLSHHDIAETELCAQEVLSWIERLKEEINEVENQNDSLRHAINRSKAFLDKFWGNFPIGSGRDVSDLDDLLRELIVAIEEVEKKKT